MLFKSMYLFNICQTSYSQGYAYPTLPSFIIMEGGYAVEEIGINTVNVLIGFEGH